MINKGENRKKNHTLIIGTLLMEIEEKRRIL